MMKAVKKIKKQQRRTSKTGLPPGTPVYTGSKATTNIHIDVINLNTESCTQYNPDLEQLIASESKDNQWVQITGIQEVSAIKSICEKYNIHFLHQEDILNVDQRPKLEDEDHYLFLCFKSLTWNESKNTLDDEQISVILTSSTLLTFCETPNDNFDSIRERILSHTSIAREKHIDYIFYRILDVTIDTFYDIMDRTGRYIEDLEDEILEKPTQETLIKIQSNKKDLMFLRKSIYPFRDVINKLTYYEIPLIDIKTRKYFRDVLDHITQNLDNVETYIDMNMSLKDIYLNTQSNEMNKVMKILTIISTIFIPLTFIVGVYGMNFRNMPELDMRYGYLTTWIVMIGIVITLIYWFKKKNWL